MVSPTDLLLIVALVGALLTAGIVVVIALKLNKRK